MEKNQTQDQEEEGCFFAVNEEYNIAYVEYGVKATSFLELLTGCRGYAMGNNQLHSVPDQPNIVTTTMPQFLARSWDRLYEFSMSMSFVPEPIAMLNSNEIATRECDTTPCHIQPATNITLDFEGPTTTIIEIPEVHLESEGNTILQLDGPASVEPEVHTREGCELVQLDEGTSNEEDVLTGETITETESNFFLI
uniref:Uncharacterized protein LOC104246354 n=1 Tax=Nicotiana sylvestris TaxID=4096 RepID=A0A1U7YNQ3_NICSY|nr:PREDICTED: uncharacterized protein LOC104246354 [Nicotiana sylvestris]